MKLFVGVPAYDGKLCAETVRALLNEQAAAQTAGIEFQVRFLPGCSLITQARNQLAADFMESDADVLLFLDADVGFEPGAMLRLVSHPAEVVGGAYRLKQDDEAYPVIWADRPELWADPATGLLEVQAVPGGFLAIRRSALETLAAAHPGRRYAHHGRAYHAWFHAPIEGGSLFGEDVAFCYDWRSVGGQVWLDPELKLTHVGGHRKFDGCVGDWLRGRMDAAA